jgi:hypothetical protein
MILKTKTVYRAMLQKKNADWYVDNAGPVFVTSNAELVSQYNLMALQLARGNKILDNASAVMKKADGVMPSIARLALPEEQMLNPSTPATFGKSFISLEKQTKKLATRGRLLESKFKNLADKNPEAWRQLRQTTERAKKRVDEFAEKKPQWDHHVNKKAEYLYPEGTEFAGEVMTRHLDDFGPLAKVDFIGEKGIKSLKQLEKFIHPASSDLLGAAAPLLKVNALARAAMLVMDFGTYMIQLQHLIGRPKEFVTTIKGGMRAFADPTFLPRYLHKNRQILAANPEVILTRGGTQEFTQVFAPGGFLGPQMKRGRWLRSQTVERFQRTWEASMDVAATELLKAFSHRAVTPRQKHELASFINEFRGVLDTNRLGINVRQRTLESLLLLAPRYNRAMASLVLDLFQGGLRGQLAREALARSTAATMLISVGFSLMRGEDLDEIVDRFDPRSKRFMLWKIGENWVGPGGKILSFWRLIGRMSRNRAHDPRDVYAYTLDPGLGFIRGNLSPVAGFGMDLVTRRSFSGEPMFESIPTFGKEMLGNFTPFWLHSMIFEGGGLRDRFVRGASELFGFRGFPLTETWKFQLYAEEHFRTNKKLNPDGQFMRWDDMAAIPEIKGHYEKVDPKGKELHRKADKALARRGLANEYLLAVEDFRLESIESLNEEVTQILKDGSGLGRVREAYSNWGRSYGVFREGLADTDEYKKAYEVLKDLPPADSFEEQLYFSYMETIMNPAFDNDVYGFDFRARDQAVDEWIAEYGKENYETVQRIQAQNYTDFHDQIQELIRVRNVLKPYWDIRDEELEKEGFFTIDPESITDENPEGLTYWEVYNRKSEARQDISRRLDHALMRVLANVDRRQAELLNDPSRNGTEIANLLYDWEYERRPASFAVMERIMRVENEIRREELDDIRRRSLR